MFVWTKLVFTANYLQHDSPFSKSLSEKFCLPDDICMWNAIYWQLSSIFLKKIQILRNFYGQFNSNLYMKYNLLTAQCKFMGWELFVRKNFRSLQEKTLKLYKNNKKKKKSNVLTTWLNSALRSHFGLSLSRIFEHLNTTFVRATKVSLTERKQVPYVIRFLAYMPYLTLK